MTLKLALKKRSQKQRLPLMKRLRSQKAVSIYLFILAWLILAVIFLITVMPKRYTLYKGEISHVTITASKDVEDELSTEVLRKSAADKVEPSYLFKEEIASIVLADLNSVLTEAKSVQQYGHGILAEQAPDNPEAQATYSFTPEEIANAKGMLSSLFFTDYQLNTLLRTSNEDMDLLCKTMTSAVKNIMNTTIRTGYVNDAIQSLQQVIGTKVSVDLLQNVATPILRQVIQPNMVVDEEATEKLRQEARDAVEPVIYKQGQYIVQAREVVTENQLAMLRSLGLLDNADIDIASYIGAFLTTIISLLVLWISLYLFNKNTLIRNKNLFIILLTLCIGTGLCALLQLISPYLYPVVFCTMLICCLLSAREAIAVIPSFCILCNGLIMGNGTLVIGIININILLTTLLSGILTVLMLKKKPYRMQILLTGPVGAVSNMIIILTTGMLTDTALADVFNNALLSAGGAGISTVLCVAIEPLADAVFHLATSSKLLELCNPNHPLLRRLMIEAPGTYHHSMIVANLAEAAAESIGANPLLARAGAYFHDIGKLKRPLYFKENQLGENPHEHTDPRVSAAIVIAHTRDGLALAQQFHLPLEIQEIISQHHGNTVTAYFYNEALKSADGKAVDINDFRYDGKTPSTKESAIIMMADTVEAAVRSMPDPTPEKIKEFIHKLIQGKLTDGQLSNAPITVGNISACENAFSTVLNGVFHERIEYPDIKLPEGNEVPVTESPMAEESRIEEKELTKKPEGEDNDH